MLPFIVFSQVPDSESDRSAIGRAMEEYAKPYEAFFIVNVE